MNEMKENLNKKGPLTISNPGPFGSIKGFGPVSATTHFTADSLKVYGPFGSSGDVSVIEADIKGPMEIEGSGTFDIIKIYGPVEIHDNLQINDKGTFNGPINVKSITGTTETIIRINGVLETDEVANIRTLHVVGVATAESISTDDEIVINLKREITKIQMIKSTNVEIGRETKVGGHESRFFGRFMKSKGFAEIDEIHATGIVELDNVKVNKVYAKEVFAGENVEIGEFIET